jgi:DNA-binding MarR family transcriptional regulator
VELERELQQTKFQSEQHKLMLNILFTASWLNRLQLCTLREVEITPPQYNILRILRGSKDRYMNLGEISNRMIDRSSNTSRLIDKLVHKKLVTRKPNDGDRRQMDIKITPEGLSLLDKMKAPIELAAEPFLQIDVNEAKQINLVLDQLRDYSKHENHKQLKIKK